AVATSRFAPDCRAWSFAGTRTVMTMYDSLCFVHPPIQHTSQSPNREPSVTGVRRRRYFVSQRMLTVVVSTFIDHVDMNVKSQSIDHWCPMSQQLNALENCRHTDQLSFRPPRAA